MKKNKPLKRILACLLALSLVSAAAVPLNAAQPAAGEPEGEYVQGQALVLYESSSFVRSAGPLAGMTVEQEWTFGQDGSLLRSAAATEKVALVSKAGMTTGELIAALEKNDAVKIAEPNYLYHPMSDPAADDTFYSTQWGLGAAEQNGVGIEKGWEADTGKNEENVIAVIDTGVDYTHPDLKNVMWNNPGDIGIEGEHGYDTGDNDDDPMPDYAELDYGNSHGTHCAGVIAAQANNAEGIAGASPNTKIMAVKIQSEAGYMMTSSIVAAFDYVCRAKQAGVNIVATSDSWGGGSESQLIRYGIDRAGQKGVLSVIAAGNSSNDNDIVGDFPASYDSPYIITVAASQQTNRLAPFSSYGHYSSDVASPGTTVLSTVAMNAYLPFLSEEYGLDKNEVYNGFGTLSYSPETMSWTAAGETEKDELQISAVRRGSLGEEGPVWEDWTGPDSPQFSVADNGYSGSALALDVPAREEEGEKIQFSISCKNPYYGRETDGAQYAGLLTSSYSSEKYQLKNRITIEQAGPEIVDYVQTNSYPDAWNSPMSEALAYPEMEYLTFDVTIELSEKVSTRILFDEFGVGATTGKYGLMSGTSMATPLVSGITGLLCSKFPDESPAQIRARVLGGTLPLDSSDAFKVASGGRVDAATAVNNPNPVVDGVSLSGGTATLSGYFLSGAAFTVDGTAVSPISQTAVSAVFDASSFEKNAYHDVVVSRDGRSFSAKLFFEKTAQPFEEGGPLPDGLVTGQLVASGDSLFYAGSQGEYFYEKTDSGWKQLDPPPSVGIWPGYLYSNGGIWMVSPSPFDTSCELYRYDIASAGWEEKGTIDTMQQMNLFSVATYNGEFYFFGNQGDEEERPGFSVTCYNPETGLVSKKPAVPQTSGLAVVAGQVGDRLVAVIPYACSGGEANEYSMRAFSFDGTEWTAMAALAPLSYEKVSFAIKSGCAASGDKLIFAGTALDGYGDCFAFDPAQNSWSASGFETGSSVNFGSAAVLRDTFYTVGMNREGDASLLTMPVQSSLRSISVQAEGGSVTGQGSYVTGDTVTLSASPGDGYRFTGWNENGVQISAEAALSFPATADRTITAQFEKTGHPAEPSGPDEGGAEPSGPSGSASPQTGDPLRTGMTALILLSMAAGTAAVRRRGKRRG